MNHQHHKIIFWLILQFCSIATDWVPYRGLWYYISPPGVSLNYTEAADNCSSSNSHLATIVDRYQWKFLNGQVRNGSYWIGLSTLRMGHGEECTGKNMTWAGDYTCADIYIPDQHMTGLDGSTCTAYTITSSKDENVRESFVRYDCIETRGFICQWQCNILSISQTNIEGNPSITGVYEATYYKSKRKVYSRITNDTQVLVYRAINCKTSPICRWVFDNSNTNKIYLNYTHYTPYNYINWQISPSSDYVNVNFVCLDCQEYLLEKPGALTVLIKQDEHGLDFANEDGTEQLYYNQTISSWCYVRNKNAQCCFSYTISPFGYILNIQACGINTILCKSMGYTYRNYSDIVVLSTNADSIDTIVTVTTMPSSSESTIQPNPNSDISNTKHLTQNQHTNTYVYISVGVGLVGIIVIIIIVSVIIYKRRQTPKNTPQRHNQNLGDGRVVVETNIYSAQPSRNGLPNTHTRETIAPTVPPRYNNAAEVHNSHVEQGRQSYFEPGAHSSSAYPHRLPNNQAFSEVNQSRRPVPQVPTEPVYSKVNKKAQYGRNKHGNVLADDIHVSDNDNESESVPQAAKLTNGVNNSDEEFSDNELYARNSPAHASALQQMQSTNDPPSGRANAFDNDVYYDDPSDECIEMYDNDVYGQRE